MCHKGRCERLKAVIPLIGSFLSVHYDSVWMYIYEPLSDSHAG